MKNEISDSILKELNTQAKRVGLNSFKTKRISKQIVEVSYYDISSTFATHKQNLEDIQDILEALKDFDIKDGDLNIKGNNCDENALDGIGDIICTSRAGDEE